MFLLKHKDWLKTYATGVFLLLFLGVPSAFGQIREPRGHYLQANASAAAGFGLNVGSVTAKTLYTREIQVISNLEPAFRRTSDQVRVMALVGVSVRLFGFERLLGNVPYRGYDIDLGFRAGPGLAFSSRDTRVDKNKRFVLVVEPMVRFSRALEYGVFFLEVGAESPHLRFGTWLPLQ